MIQHCIQLAIVAIGFPDVIDTCMQVLDKVSDTAGPLILQKGHGGKLKTQSR